MNPIRCLIVDDEPLALQLLESYVRRTPFLTLVAACGSAVEALGVLKADPIDLAFLDIQMPEINGLELSKMAQSTTVVFTTAFEQYAVEGYKVGAADYLLKPFSYAEFLAAAGRAAQRIELLETAKPNAGVCASSNRLLIKSDYRQQVIETDRILYIESAGDYLKIFLDDGSFLQTLMTLYAMLEQLPTDDFVRVHRSYVVNIRQVRIIDRGRIQFGKNYVPVSDSYRDEFTARFNACNGVLK